MPVDELIARLGLSTAKVQEMQRQNELPFRRIEIGGRIMFSRRAYDAWLSQYDYTGGSKDDGSKNHQAVPGR